MERSGSTAPFAIDIGKIPSSPTGDGGRYYNSNSAPSSFPSSSSLQLPKRRYLFIGAGMLLLCTYFAIHIGLSITDLDAVHERNDGAAHEPPFFRGAAIRNKKNPLVASAGADDFLFPAANKKKNKKQDGVNSDKNDDSKNDGRASNKEVTEAAETQSVAEVTQIPLRESNAKENSDNNNLPPPPPLHNDDDVAVPIVDEAAMAEKKKALDSELQLPPPSPKDEWTKEANEVKKEMLDCWEAYRKYAWGHDQLKPISRSYNDWSRAGHALTIVDSLGTLWLMGAKDAFMEGMKRVTEEVNWDSDTTTSVFESTIRIVGGLLSAYELSGEQFPQLLASAKKMGDILLWSYNTSAGLPHQTIHFQSRDHWNAGWSRGSSILADMGTSTIEFRTLSYLTRDPVYDIKATHVNSVLTQLSAHEHYMAGVWWNPDDASVTNNLKTLGAYGDSYFEYMLKQYLLTGKTEAHHKHVTEQMLDYVMDRYVRTSPDKNLTWLTDSQGTSMVEHLLCFTGGMYALASWSLPNNPNAAKYLELGKGLGEMCYQMYARNVNGIAPDAVSISGNGMHTRDSKYILRPETVESLFYLWRVTKDDKYRRMSYTIFDAIRKNCKRNETGGYSGLRNVNEHPLTTYDDDQQTFFLAETLKYIYLTFADESKLPLTQWVFNTEGHPVKIRKRDPMDVWRQWEKDHNGDVAFFPPTVNGVEDRETDRMKAVRNGKRIVAERDPHSHRER